MPSVVVAQTALTARCVAPAQRRAPRCRAVQRAHRIIRHAEPEATTAVQEAPKKEDTAGEDDAQYGNSQAEDTARKAAANDPLEKFCGDNPETDECRVYED